MFRIFLLISTLIFSFTLTSETNALYTPGANISMTGVTASGTRFDVASTLFGFDATVPVLVTATRSFTGAFYVPDLGWVMLSTGSYQVDLNCGAQPLNNLTANCSLYGTGWSENAGDVYFSSGTTITYNYITGLLEGKALSFIGDIDITGIILPLLPATINETTLIANHTAVITISNSSFYEGGSMPWNLRINPISNPHIRNIAGGIGGIFPVDLSLATTYELEITDTNGSTTTLNFPVTSGVPSITLEPSNHYAKSFCEIYNPDSRCPDAGVRLATTLSLPGGPFLANGTDSPVSTIRTRDKYGNRVTNGNIQVVYTTTVKNVQVDPLSGTGNINYGPSLEGDAFLSSDLINSFIGISNRTFLLGVTDVSYNIASTAPSNTLDNIIQLNTIIYTSGGINTPLPIITSPLIFVPIYTASISALIPPIGMPHTFDSHVVKNDPSTPIIPTVISTMQINDGLSSEWRTLSSIPPAICTREPNIPFPASLCDWDNVAVVATDSDSDFNFTGIYTTWLPIPPLETTSLNSYIYYMMSGKDILYQTQYNTILGAGIIVNPRVRIFGQSSKGLYLGSRTRIDFINNLRKNTALLSRNRTDYSAANYVIYTGNHTILDAEFTTKRTIISIGGNLTINENISNRNHPLAIIALTDANGNGGNILIKGTVTDINSSLIAEHAITSEISNYQLYIHGSMISSNPPQDTAPTSCPYFVPSCTLSDYDLPTMRIGYTAPTNASLSGSTYATPLIIKIDTRLSTDPPPAMDK